MKNKLLILALILAIFVPIVTYGNNTGGTFFRVDKMEVAPEDTVTMTVDLSKISYEEFEFTLSSNVSLNTITTDEAVDTSASGNVLKIESSKSDLSMQQIELYYKVPQDLAIGSTITLTGRIEPTQTVISTPETTVPEESVPAEDSTAEEENVENVVENTVQESVEVQPDETVETVQPIEPEAAQEVTIVITVVQETEKDDSMEEAEDKEKMPGESMNMQKDQMDKEKMTDKQDMEKTAQESQVPQVTAVSTTQTVTYKGDSNNYLSSLVVEGYELSPAFLKTSNTYFVNVASDVTSLDITAEAEDSGAKVRIYGDGDLQVGENKVLVSVTAENGDVRIYRIYVKKEV